LSGGLGSYGGYTIPPQGYYALWKYAQIAGNAHQILTTCGTIPAAPSALTLASYPEAHNAWIAGYQGYVNLLQLDGQSTTNAQNTLNSLMSSRLANLSVSSVVNSSWNSGTQNYRQLIGASRNMMYMTPELGTYLRNASSVAANTYNVLSSVAPYWMSTNFDAGYGENAVAFNIDYPAFFGAKAWIMNATREDLVRYLDGPAYPRGDLNFINNAVTVLEAPSNGSPSPTNPPTATDTPTPSCPKKTLGDANCDSIINREDLLLTINQMINNGTPDPARSADFNHDGVVNRTDLVIVINGLIS
jgi:hypothetical protein